MNINLKFQINVIKKTLTLNIKQNSLFFLKEQRKKLLKVKKMRMKNNNKKRILTKFNHKMRNFRKVRNLKEKSLGWNNLNAIFKKDFKII